MKFDFVMKNFVNDTEQWTEWTGTEILTNEVHYIIIIQHYDSIQSE